MCEPMVQASGWRVQKPRRSSTVAEAAEIASDARVREVYLGSHHG